MRPNPQNKFFTTKKKTKSNSMLALPTSSSILFPLALEMSYPWSKEKTTLSLVINRVKFTQKKTGKKKYISIQERRGNSKKPSIFLMVFWVSERLHCCYIYFHYSYLDYYYKCSRTLCIECWVSYWDLIKFPYFRDATERRVRGWKEAQRPKVNLWIFLTSLNSGHAN
jgi:hypothetical protein